MFHHTKFCWKEGYKLIRTEYIDVDFNLKLQKDLQEYEIICSHCGGTGLQVDNNPFGLKNENSKVPFPYKQQTIVGCRHCYKGVQSKCLHCGKILDRSSYQCDCNGAKNERIQEQHKKDLEIWIKAKKISYKEACEEYIMLFIDNYDKYIMIEDLEEWIKNEEYNNEELISRRSLRIYGTESINIKIEAYDIIENACSDLHEDAMDNIGSAEEEKLQTFLDKWCEENSSGTTSYYADFKVGIEL